MHHRQRQASTSSTSAAAAAAGAAVAAFAWGRKNMQHGCTMQMQCVQVCMQDVELTLKNGIETQT